MWGMKKNAPVVVFSDHADAVNSVALRADGSRVVTASDDDTARIPDTATGAVAATLRHDDAVNSAAFAADGSRVVTASDDKTGAPMGRQQRHGDRHSRRAYRSRCRRDV